MSYLVYMHTAPNGNAYIGRTKNYKKRCNDHKNGNKCLLFQAAIQEFGWDNFKHEILKDELSLEDANFWEEFYIKHFNTFEPNGFNMQTGGVNCKRSNSSKERMSISKKGITTWNKGKKLSPEHAAKCGLAMKGKKKTTEQIMKTVSKNLGRKRSPQFCEKMKELNMGRKEIFSRNLKENE